MIIKCLSLWQPWAEAMRRGLKANETRSWFTSYRGWLAIHAAKKEYHSIDYTSDFHDVVLRQLASPSRFAYGAVVCIVRLVACERSEKIRDLISESERFWGNYEDGRGILVTTSLIVPPRPIPLTGHQGLFNWEVPEDIAQLIAAKSEAFEERAALKEFCGNLSREQAEKEAREEVYGK